jgi:hypothetical protein
MVFDWFRCTIAYVGKQFLANWKDFITFVNIKSKINNILGSLKPIYLFFRRTILIQLQFINRFLHKLSLQNLTITFLFSHDRARSRYIFYF